MRSRSLNHAGAAVLALSLGALLGAGGCGKTRTELPAVVPLFGADLPELVKDQYFVVMPEDSAEAVFAGTEQQVKDLGGAVLHRYQTVINGFLANLPPEALQALRRNPA